MEADIQMLTIRKTMYLCTLIFYRVGMKFLANDTRIRILFNVTRAMIMIMVGFVGLQNISNILSLIFILLLCLLFIILFLYLGGSIREYLGVTQLPQLLHNNHSVHVSN
ncbi:hypothetical protein V8G54_028434 [Vigna mungo]|uniref:Uncharacterized protein n=1 Tax=Vigna mungo TaxID=3915 RepID=A0AAQ3RKV3_VIGMU